MQEKILITGSSGMLGMSLTPFLKQLGCEVLTQGRRKGVDYRFALDNKQQCYESLGRIRPNIIINLAGLTNVDICEADINRAFRDNVIATENVVSWIEDDGGNCFLVHVSTDHVYDGCGPQCEDEITIRNNYAMTKYAGELAVLRVQSSVLRTNFFGRSQCPGRLSFTDWIYNSLASEVPLTLFNDVFFSPLSIRTLMQYIANVIEEKNIGIFNLGSVSGLSKYEFGIIFADSIGLNTGNICSISVSEALDLKATRPKDMRMNSSKFGHSFNLNLPKLADQIKLLAEDYNE